jgi:RHS repeat-associated protein
LVTWVVLFDLNVVSGTNFYLDVIADYESGGAVEDRHVFTSSGHQSYTITAAANLYRLRLGTTSPATTPYNFNIDNLVVRRVDADSSSFIAEVVSAQDYSPFGAPLPGRSKTFTESASSSVISNENFTSGVNGWTTSGIHSVLTGNYYGQLAATITGRGTDPEGMQKTFATEEGNMYKVVFTVNTIGWPSFRVQDSTSGSNILATGMQLPGTYSYTFVARGSRTTLYFEEIEAVNSTLVLSSLIFSEEGKSSEYRYGFGGQEKDGNIFIGAYTAEYWEYDARLGRRWNLDPVVSATQSPYSVFNNNPICFVDPSGLEATGAGDKPKKPQGDSSPDPDKGVLRNGIDLEPFVVQASRPEKTSILRRLWQGIKQAVSSIGHAIMGAEFAYMSNNIPAMSIARFAIDCKIRSN